MNGKTEINFETLTEAIISLALILLGFLANAYI